MVYKSISLLIKLGTCIAHLTHANMGVFKGFLGSNPPK